MKTLTAGQQGMIKSMRESGKTAQANAIEKGIKDAPAKKYGTEPMKKDPATKAEKTKKAYETMEYRRGKGRIKVTRSDNPRGKGKLASGTGEVGKRLESAGEIKTKVAGSAGSRSAGIGRIDEPRVRVVREKTASAIKPKGVQSSKVNKTDVSEDLKKKAPRKKVKTVSAITPVKKKGVKGLKKAALKKYGSKPIKKYGCKK